MNLTVALEVDTLLLLGSELGVHFDLTNKSGPKVLTINLTVVLEVDISI